jgi:hypothetical protein
VLAILSRDHRPVLVRAVEGAPAVVAFTMLKKLLTMSRSVWIGFEGEKWIPQEREIRIPLGQVDAGAQVVVAGALPVSLSEGSVVVLVPEEARAGELWRTVLRVVRLGAKTLEVRPQ